MEYEDIQEKLSALRTVRMTPQRGQQIDQVIQNEIQKYQARGRWRVIGRKLGGVGSAAAAVVVCAIGVGAVMHIHQTHVGTTTNYTTASHGPTTTVPISYKTAQLTQINQVASAVGVTPMIPSQGQQGDVLTIIKNGGKGNLILDYKTFWIIESTTPISEPQGMTTRKTISVGAQSGTYFSNSKNSFLYFHNNGIYVAIQGLQVGKRVSEQNLQAIATSFKSVQ